MAKQQQENETLLQRIARQRREREEAQAIKEAKDRAERESQWKTVSRSAFERMGFGHPAPAPAVPVPPAIPPRNAASPASAGNSVAEQDVAGPAEERKPLRNSAGQTFAEQQAEKERQERKDREAAKEKQQRRRERSIQEKNAKTVADAADSAPMDRLRAAAKRVVAKPADDGRKENGGGTVKSRLAAITEIALAEEREKARVEALKTKGKGNRFDRPRPALREDSYVDPTIQSASAASEGDGVSGKENKGDRKEKGAESVQKTHVHSGESGREEERRKKKKDSPERKERRVKRRASRKKSSRDGLGLGGFGGGLVAAADILEPSAAAIPTEKKRRSPKKYRTLDRKEAHALRKTPEAILDEYITLVLSHSDSSKSDANFTLIRQGLENFWEDVQKSPADVLLQLAKPGADHSRYIPVCMDKKSEVTQLKLIGHLHGFARKANNDSSRLQLDKNDGSIRAKTLDSTVVSKYSSILRTAIRRNQPDVVLENMIIDAQEQGISPYVTYAKFTEFWNHIVGLSDTTSIYSGKELADISRFLPCPEVEGHFRNVCRLATESTNRNRDKDTGIGNLIKREWEGVDGKDGAITRVFVAHSPLAEAVSARMEHFRRRPAEQLALTREKLEGQIAKPPKRATATFHEVTRTYQEVMETVVPEQQRPVLALGFSRLDTTFVRTTHNLVRDINDLKSRIARQNANDDIQSASDDLIRTKNDRFATYLETLVDIYKGFYDTAESNGFSDTQVKHVYKTYFLQELVQAKVDAREKGIEFPSQMERFLDEAGRGNTSHQLFESYFRHPKSSSEADGVLVKQIEKFGKYYLNVEKKQQRLILKALAFDEDFSTTLVQTLEGMMTRWKAAKEILGDEGSSKKEKKAAQALQENILKWFKGEGNDPTEALLHVPAALKDPETYNSLLGLDDHFNGRTLRTVLMLSNLDLDTCSHFTRISNWQRDLSKDDVTKTIGAVLQAETERYQDLKEQHERELKGKDDFTLYIPEGVSAHSELGKFAIQVTHFVHGELEKQKPKREPLRKRTESVTAGLEMPSHLVSVATPAGLHNSQIVAGSLRQGNGKNGDFMLVPASPPPAEREEGAGDRQSTHFRMPARTKADGRLELATSNDDVAFLGDSFNGSREQAAKMLDKLNRKRSESPSPVTSTSSGSGSDPDSDQERLVTATPLERAGGALVFGNNASPAQRAASFGKLVFQSRQASSNGMSRGGPSRSRDEEESLPSDEE